MRRVLSLIAFAFALIGVGFGVGGTAAFATPPPAPGAAEQAVPGKKVCTISDGRLDQLSGIVATKDGFIVVNDSSDDPSRNQVFYLDRKCRVVKEVGYSGSVPRDTEDLALSPDGKTLWIADIGDNPTIGKRREAIALWSMPANGSAQPVIHRLTYPDGPRDAAALLFNGDGTPIIVTREPGKSGLYVPTDPLKPKAAEGVPLKKVGEVTLPRTDTSNVLGAAGRLVVSGGVVAPDGSRAALRTYADAFEWDVTDGDVVGALTNGRPRATPLPDEPRGEAITYSTDGATFYTVSATAHLGGGTKPTILSYTPSTQQASTEAAGDVGKSGDGTSWFDNLDLQDITYLIGAVGVLGAILVGSGVFGILRARRKPVAADPDGDGDEAAVGSQQAASAAEDRHRGGSRPSGTYGAGGGAVYGGGGAGGGSVYGAGGSRGGGAVYGGDSSGGGPVYGAGAQPEGGSYGGGPAGGGRGGGPVYGGGRASGGRGGGPVYDGDPNGAERGDGSVYGGGGPAGPAYGGRPAAGDAYGGDAYGGGTYGDGAYGGGRPDNGYGYPDRGRYSAGGWSERPGADRGRHPR